MTASNTNANPENAKNKLVGYFSTIFISFGWPTISTKLLWLENITFRKKYFNMINLKLHLSRFMRKTVAAIIFVGLMITSATITLGQLTVGQPTVGVKAGYWVEYTVKTTGTPPAAQDITWAKIEILDVEGEQFHANFTVRYVNGTASSAVRTFNFTAGNVQAWIIIPANLNPGQFFYDSSINSNVTIQGQLQKTVVGATRTITYASSTLDGVERNKQWDKATGFYIQSVDNITTAAPATVNDGLAYTVNARAIATDIWGPQILGLNQTVFYVVVVIIIIVIALIVSVVIFTWKRKTTKQ